MKGLLKFVTFGGLFITPFLVLLVADSYFFPYITGKNFAFRIIVEVVFASWVGLALLEPKYRPKKSWILTAFLAFLGIMFLANWQGVSRISSFVSNFERMDGYVTLVHVFLFVLVLGSVFQTKKDWSLYLNITTFVAFMLFLANFQDMWKALFEGAGIRAEGSLGNAAYLAIYLLFHVFIALWLLVRSKERYLQIAYGLLIVAFSLLLVATGTRGTVIGLGAGLLSVISYVAVFGYKIPKLRNIALGTLAVLVLLAGSFYSLRNSEFVQNNYNLARIANLDLGKDLKVRGTVWEIAWEGVKEKPVLGWGQSNFNFVFNKYFDPFMYDQEQWFDRSHNIFFDWLVAGGFLGLISYLSIFLACFYYLLVVPFRKRKDDNKKESDEDFSVLERAVLFGVLIGYFVHNVVVFDNIVSYIFFAVFLAMLHSQVGRPIAYMEKLKVEKTVIEQIVVPVLAVAVFMVFYSFHKPAMAVAGDLIKAARTEYTSPDKLKWYMTALERDSFMKQEITEQMSQVAIDVAQMQGVPDEVRQDFFVKTEESMKDLLLEKPGDARLHIFFSSFYRAFGDLENAKEQAEIARELSPKKQYIISQQGIIAFLAGDYEEARDLFKESWELDERNKDALAFYFGTLTYTDEKDKIYELVEEEEAIEKVATSDFVFSAVKDYGDLELLAKLQEARLEKDTSNKQEWINLSAIYYEMGEVEKSIEVLERSIEADPSLEKSAACFIDALRAGSDPNVECAAAQN